MNTLVFKDTLMLIMHPILIIQPSTFQHLQIFMLDLTYARWEILHNVGNSDNCTYRWQNVFDICCQKDWNVLLNCRQVIFTTCKQ